MAFLSSDVEVKHAPAFVTERSRTVSVTGTDHCSDNKLSFDWSTPLVMRFIDLHSTESVDGTGTTSVETGAFSLDFDLLFALGEIEVSVMILRFSEHSMLS